MSEIVVDYICALREKEREKVKYFVSFCSAFVSQLLCCYPPDGGFRSFQWLPDNLMYSPLK